MSNVLFLMMGGIGSRFGASKPKQFTEVEGNPIFKYIVEAYDESDIVDEMIIICNAEWVDYAQNYLSDYRKKHSISIVSGGKTRSESVKKGLEAKIGDIDDDDCVLIHDATHPYLDKEAVSKALLLMDEYDGVTICQREYDTCYRVSDNLIVEEIPKKAVVVGASPEIFRFADLKRMYLGASDEYLESMSSAGAMAVSNGLKIGIVQSDLLNIKITHPHDMDLFKKLCSSYYFKGDL